MSFKSLSLSCGRCEGLSEPKFVPLTDKNFRFVEGVLYPTLLHYKSIYISRRLSMKEMRGTYGIIWRLGMSERDDGVLKIWSRLACEVMR